ncbi:response regulator transcription factor [Vulcanococcus sp. Clear-D1]|jgi:DNA-binding response OmpR family regulator|uniref:response regulator transcription factor n=1 Tax=Vulcanococcus sp. Clear-D1 TaxID=2766970 RepID=UPI0019A0C837|nr:response regulator transcription factor [Vulcanococcus sp. Clear-D1]MBD1194281.1 response regulator transcription factor [Vulcanococcus sp. Clear-D1]
MKVLIVEDDPVIRDALKELLQHWGLVTEACGEGLEALTLLEAGSFDLVLLDLNLPGLDGLEVCRKLRHLPVNQPLVLMLTARDSLDDNVLGLEQGADDYLVKPFEPALLKARIQALLRRAARPLREDWSWGALQLGLDGRTATFNAQDLRLTPKEHALLEALLKAGGRTCSKEQLIESAWAWADVPGDESVKTHVKNIRAKLNQVGAPPDLIETVYGVGFRLNASHA